MTSRKNVFVTRQSVECPFFGSPKELSRTSLPTYEDMLLCCLEEKYNRALILNPNNKKDLGFSAVAELVATQIVNIYRTASIPTVTHTRVVQMITSYFNAYIGLKKSYNRDHEKDFYKKKVDVFITNAKTKLFDIATCKCPMTILCTCENKSIDYNCLCPCPVAIKCNCEKLKKIPDIELKFVHDQRTTRMLFIGNLDRNETVKLIKREERREQLSIQESIISDPVSPVTSKSKINQNISLRTSCDMSLILPSTSQMRSKLSHTSLLSDRYGVSDRATAAIASGVLHDLGMISDSDMSQVIDRSKIRREKVKTRKAIKGKYHQLKEVKAIYFDGRRDNTLVQEKIGAKMYRRVRKEEHITLICEPDSQYIGHITPKTGTGKDIAESIFGCMNMMDFDMNEVVAIGCDGTVTNTGWKNGVVQNIEVRCQRPMQWFICLLHFNELPYKHLFEHLDGTTTGPASFSGPIGKQLPSCEKNPVVDFVPIQSEVITINKTDLSKDQQYLLHIIRAVISGFCDPELAVKDPGTLSNSRWLTCANRVLRLYVSQISPTSEMKTLVNYIVKTYAPVWFDIKMHYTMKDGPKHILKVIQTTRHFPDNIKEIIDPVIQRNSFFCHPENMMLAMIFDERQHIRELGYRRILKARHEAPVEGHIRPFKLSTINFQATDYTELIDWTNCKLTPPPLLSSMTTEYISTLLNNKALPEFEYLKFPCHTQSVERCVKLVTEAAGKVCGHENREGFIKTTLRSRFLMPKFDSKSEFKGASM